MLNFIINVKQEINRIIIEFLEFLIFYLVNAFKLTD